MRYHYTSIRIVKIHNTDNHCWQEMESNSKSHSLLVGMQTGLPTLKGSIVYFYKVNTVLSYDLAIVVLGIYLKEFDVSAQKSAYGIYTNFIYDCQSLEATKMPFTRWKDK